MRKGNKIGKPHKGRSKNILFLRVREALWRALLDFEKLVQFNEKALPISMLLGY